MLILYVEKPGLEIVNDVEKEFDTLKLKGTATEKRLIEKIEKGKWNDSDSYIDRFGFKLRISDMSTGCKAALCVANLPEKVINLRECGLNARDIIISLCENGKVLLPEPEVTIVDYSDGNVHVQLDGYIFLTIKRLNRYLFEERPFQPNPDAEVEYV